jgi:hypothetical protein
MLEKVMKGRFRERKGKTKIGLRVFVHERAEMLFN